MTAPDLKPCPFCGGGASISKDYDPEGSGAFYAVKCQKCRAKSPEIYAVETCNIHFAQVRDTWNTRAPADALAVPEVAALVDAAETLLNRCTDEDLVAKALMRNLRTKIAALRAIGEPRNG